MNRELLHVDALSLLKELIAIPSFSRAEDKTATVMMDFLSARGIPAYRYKNNIWAVSRAFNPGLPTVLLNSHHDTVKPVKQYTRDPFHPEEEAGKLFGLGSNDAGGCLVSLIATFVHFYDSNQLPFNLVLAATAEEEITGSDGIEALLAHEDFLKCVHIDRFKQNFARWCAIVGEPTELNLAVAEKGLMVLDITSRGIAGHAARDEGENALYLALDDIRWFRSFQYPRQSEWLGAVKQTVTVINTGNTAHNVVPDHCDFVVDIRIPDCYTHEEIRAIVRENIRSEVRERNLRLRSSYIDLKHPLVRAGLALGKRPYGSPTCSDKGLMPFPALKCGPGSSSRSHMADEFIFTHEIREGIDTYIKMLDRMGGMTI
jgi:acetylornithine deacetylase